MCFLFFRLPSLSCFLLFFFFFFLLFPPSFFCFFPLFFFFFLSFFLAFFFCFFIFFFLFSGLEIKRHPGRSPKLLEGSLLLTRHNPREVSPVDHSLLFEYLNTTSLLSSTLLNFAFLFVRGYPKEAQGFFSLPGHYSPPPYLTPIDEK